MPTVREIVRRLLPYDDAWNESGGWPVLPTWPPDVFAVAATLVEMSGCYVHPRYIAYWRRSCVHNDDYLENVRRIGEAWRTRRLIRNQERYLSARWRELGGDGEAEVAVPERERRLRRFPIWLDSAMNLLAIADEASAGLGFLGSDELRPLADFVGEEFRLMLDQQPTALYLPYSLCSAVPATELCVQPKSRTPQVGCTIRSLSHHLALLPRVGMLSTSWIPQHVLQPTGERPFNLLVVPFPYRVSGASFTESPLRNGQRVRFFELKQEWLLGEKRKLSPQRLSRFLMELVEQAKREVRAVHGIVLPETALSADLAGKVAKRLAAARLELFICGVLQPGRGNRLPKNLAYTFPFKRGKIPFFLAQSKQHRWRLDRNQIQRYSLGDALDPKSTWWEKVDIGERELAFVGFRQRASLAALVCEDLARIDPAQTALRSIGPNLVIALLMDGPQHEWRWPGRYATVLADDPGSAVLTVTSLGMVKRDRLISKRGGPYPIALWKEPGGDARELSLDPGSHALVLTLTLAREEQLTLDGRSDGASAVRVSLSGVSSISHPTPPPWLDGAA